VGGYDVAIEVVDAIPLSPAGKLRTVASEMTRARDGASSTEQLVTQ